jgi:hypothetical protein
MRLIARDKNLEHILKIRVVDMSTNTCMTESQYLYLTDLIQTHEYNIKLSVVEQLSILKHHYINGSISRCVASEMIKKALQTPERAEPTIKEGVYYFKGLYVKVVRAIHGSRKLYGKVFDPESKIWKYSPGILVSLQSCHKLSLDEARKFGELYGRCVICGRTLTDDESIEAGMGIVCRKNFGV